jgi:hypothetical protein
MFIEMKVNLKVIIPVIVFSSLFLIILLSITPRYQDQQVLKEPVHARFEANDADALLNTFLRYSFTKLNPYLFQEVAKENELWGVAIYLTEDDINTFDNQTRWEYWNLVKTDVIRQTDTDRQLHVRAFVDETHKNRIWLSAHHEYSRKNVFKHFTDSSAKKGEELLLIFLGETGWLRKAI